MKRSSHALSGNKHGLILTGFALVVTSALALTQCVTKNHIEINEAMHRQKALAQVLPAQWYDHSLEEYKVELFDQAANRNRICYSHCDRCCTRRLLWRY